MKPQNQKAAQDLASENRGDCQMLCVGEEQNGALIHTDMSPAAVLSRWPKWGPKMIQPGIGPRTRVNLQNPPGLISFDCQLDIAYSHLRRQSQLKESNLGTWGRLS